MKTRGRPPKPEGGARNDVLRVRLTDEERKQLDAAANERHLDTSTWARAELLTIARNILAKRQD